MADFVQTLVEMGFPKDKAEKAVQVTGNKGVEPAMEWILQNIDADKPGPSAVTTGSTNNPEESSNSNGGTEAAPVPDGDGVVRSYKCEDCGKVLKDTAAMEFHAAKTNHSNFTESNEEKKPLTEEEKAEQMKLVEEKLKIKRKEREEREKQDELEREKSRVQMGKDLAEAKRRLQDQEMREIAEARRREKIDDKKARDRVKAQIEADKLARKAKFSQGVSGSGSEQSIGVVPVPQPIKLEEPEFVAVKKDYKETKLQLRLPTGKTLVQSFGVSEPLAAVRLYIEINRNDGVVGPFNLMTSFPRKIYQGDEYDMPLEALGLVPSAVLMVTKSV